ncbi:hypothetical protein [Terriglobus tenax]|uniref:hypothetical protein n=1 Tax=Terriglobus tenax TaxID=1111115 RepID=UPI0021DFD663|nr:hypothetical protein [Terriglobus tenax]
MRALLITIITAIAAALGGCVVVLSALVVAFVQGLHGGHINPIHASVNGYAVVSTAMLAGIGGYLMARLFLSRRS